MNSAESWLKTGLKLLALSFVVGLVLAMLDIDPRDLIADIPGTIRAAFNRVMRLLTWAWPYIALGAVLVVPAWIVIVVLRMMRGR